MKKVILALAAAGLAASPLLAQPQRGPPGADARRARGRGRADPLRRDGLQRPEPAGDAASRRSFSSPFAIRSLSIRPGDRWQICVNPGFRPPCTTVTRPIADASILGITGQVGSIRLLPDPNAAAN